MDLAFAARGYFAKLRDLSAAARAGMGLASLNLDSGTHHNSLADFRSPLRVPFFHFFNSFLSESSKGTSA